MVILFSSDLTQPWYYIPMDRKSKILLIIIIILAVVSVGFTFYKTVILGDFEIIEVPPSAELNI